MNWIIIASMAVCLAIGFYAGWISREDHNEARQYADYHFTPAGKHARSWEHLGPSTDQLAVLYGKPYPSTKEEAA